VEPGVQAAVGPVNVRDDYNKMQSDASHGNYLGATRDGVSATKDYAATVGAGAKIASTIAPKLLGPGAARLAAGAGPAGMVIGAGATGLAIGNTMCDIADSDMSRRSYYGKNAAGQDQTPMERASQLGVQTEDALAKRGHPTLGKVAGAGVAGFESIPAGIIGTAQAAPQIASTGVTMLGMATGFGANDPIDSATGLKQSEINQLAAQGATSQDPNAVAAVKAQREAALQQTVDPRNQ
jgi:hypothetical protein